MNCLLCESVKGRDALPRKCECNFCCVRVSGVEDELCKFMACANDAKLVVERDVRHGFVGDGTHDNL